MIPINDVTSSYRKPHTQSDQIKRRTISKCLIQGVFALFLVSFCGITPCMAQAQTAVQKHGKLSVSGNRIVDQNGTPVQLRGMSLFWSQWVPQYWTYNTLKWLRDDWKITVIRAPLGINGNTDGYLVDPAAEKAKMIAVVDAAIQLGIYVIIDWHAHTANDNLTESKAFFAEMAQRYGNSANVLYETWNEPLDVSWATVIKPYHQALITTIRQYDPDNIIICGTRKWSQQVAEASLSKLTGTNIAYTLHFYADSHREWLRTAAQTALNNGIALFVTEYGTTAADGNGFVNEGETRLWYNFLDANKIGYANWSVSNNGQTSAAFISNVSPNGGWPYSEISQSGRFVRAEMLAKAPALASGTPIAAGIYSLRNRASGKMLDNLGSITNGTGVGQYTDGSSYNQRWNVSYTGSYAKLTCLTGSRCLDSLNETDVNRPVGQWASSTSYNQQWTILSLGNGYYKIINRANSMCLDSGGQLENEDIMEFWGSGVTYNQQWQFVTP